MKMRFLNVLKSFSLALPLMMVLPLMIGGGGVAEAFNPQPEPPGSPALGIIASQSAQISASFHPPDEIGEPPDDIGIVLRFLNETGDVIDEERFMLSPGQTIHFNLHGGRFPGRNLRNVFRTEVKCFQTPRRDERRHRRRRGMKCSRLIKAGLELFDSETGRTSIAVGVGVPDRFLPPDEVGRPGPVPGPGR